MQSIYRIGLDYGTHRDYGNTELCALEPFVVDSTDASLAQRFAIILTDEEVNVIRQRVCWKGVGDLNR